MEAHRYRPIKTEFDRAVLSQLFEGFFLAWHRCEGAALSKPRAGRFCAGPLGHDLLNTSRGALETPVMAFGNDPDDRQDASVQCCRDKVGGGEALTLPLVIGWGICFQSEPDGE